MALQILFLTRKTIRTLFKLLVNSISSSSNVFKNLSLLSLPLPLQLGGKASVCFNDGETVIQNCHDEKLRLLLKDMLLRQLIQL